MSASGSTDGDRLDAALAARGLARSRTRAAQLIADGMVTVDGKPAGKPSQRVRDNEVLAIVESDGYVSRAALKLRAALESFPIEVSGRIALDLGASTGGFTQVLLERGADQVVALDVGHGQLAQRIRDDPRVTVIERENARFLNRGVLSAAGVAESPTLVVADLSFISIGLVLPAVVETVGTRADFVMLVKPQFEVGRGGSREGVVRDPALREDAVNGVLCSAWDLGLRTAGIISSPITGAAGNHEYLVWFSAAQGRNPTEWTEQVSELARI